MSTRYPWTSRSTVEFLVQRRAMERDHLVCSGSIGSGSSRLGVGPCGRNPQIGPWWNLETGEDGGFGD